MKQNQQLPVTTEKRVIKVEDFSRCSYNQHWIWLPAFILKAITVCFYNVL